MTDKRVPVLLHVPKTGGTAFTRFLEQSYGGQCIKGWEPAVTKRLKAVDGNTSAVIVRGGVPDVLGWEHEGKKFVPIVILRNPIDRALSQYYQYSRGTHVAKKFGMKSGMSLDQFLVDKSGRTMIEDYQLRSLILPFRYILEKYVDHWKFCRFRTSRQTPKTRAMMLEKANDVLRCCIVGITEKLYCLRREVIDSFNIRNPAPLTVQNVSENRIKRSHLTKSQLSTIQSLTTLDQQLYDTLRSAWPYAG